MTDTEVGIAYSICLAVATLAIVTAAILYAARNRSL
jgi:hypothetical protein